MCGFAGFFQIAGPLAGGSSGRTALQCMGEAIAHRGPDDVAYLHDGPLGLVFRRLAIQDVFGGRQPIESESRRHVAVVNGEIYNHAAIRRQLEARHRFASRSDSEAALHAWEEWGESAFGRLTGMFAMALWDRSEKTLTLVRDRLGIKPLYVCDVPGGILFGSELKALLAHPDCPREPDWAAVRQSEADTAYVTSYVVGIEQIPGGETLTIGAGGRRAKKTWWSLNDHLGTAPLGDAPGPYVDRYAELIQQVTADHLQRDVGAGLMLSGGLDSSLLASIVSRADPGLPCFTILEHGSVAAGDIDAACELTGTLGLPWHAVCLDHRGVVANMGFDLDAFERSVWMMDSPRFDLEWLFKSEVHRVARSIYPDLKVMLLGQGADEFAGGYSHRLDSPHPDWAHYLRDEVIPLVGRAGERSPFHRLMLRQVRQLQQFNLWHEDRSSSWNAVEARVPFLDHRLVELLAGVPESLHERLFWNKRIVRHAFAMLAPGLRVPQTKLGFLCTPDLASVEAVMRDVVLTVYPEFRDRYPAMPHPSLDQRTMDRDVEHVRRFGADFGRIAHELAQKMAAAVFARQCTGHRPAAGTGRAGALPVLTRKDWPGLRARFAEPPRADEAWPADCVVALRDGVRVIARKLADGRTSFEMSLEAEQLGAVKLPDARCWQARLLLALSAGPVSGRTVHEWATALDVPSSELGALLNMLLLRGALEVPAEECPASDRLVA